MKEAAADLSATVATPCSRGVHMGNWLEIILLAIASMFWPTLIVIVVLALRVPNPVKILFWFLVGGLLTTIAVGSAVVFLLQDSSFVSGSNPSADPVLDISIGVLSLLAALLLIAQGSSPRRPSPRPRMASARPRSAP